MNTNRELAIADQLINMAEAIRLTAETFAHLVEEQGYQPASAENAIVFMSGLKLSADSLTNLLKEQGQLIQVHNEIMRMELE